MWAFARPFLTLEGRGDRSAVGYMLISVAVSSMAPLMIAVVGVGHVPFLFTAAMQVGGMSGYLFLLFARYRSLLVDPRVWAAVRGHVLRLDHRTIWFFLGVVSGLDYALFVWSTRFIDISVTTILFETWPLFLVLLMAVLYRGADRYRRLSFSLVLLLVVGFVGCALVIGSQHGGFAEFPGRIGTVLAFGAGLAVCASLATSLAAYLFRWGSELAEGLPEDFEGRLGNDQVSLEMFCVAIGIVMSDLFSIALNGSIGLSFGESAAPGIWLAGFLGGVLIYALGSMSWRISNLTTANLGANALGYGAPVAALVLLWVFSQAEVARPGLLVIGAALVISTNVLINFEAEVRWGFKTLLLALGTCGAVVYMREEFFGLLDVEAWQWKSGGYFESITLSATVFTLLLAFRVARLVSRTSEEDNRTFIIYRNLDLLSRRGVVDSEVCGYVIEIDRSNDLERVREFYRRARECIAEVIPTVLNEADAQLLGQAESNLDALVRSRQVDIHLGEMFALVIFAAVTVSLALFSLPPGVEGWTRLMADVFAMVVSSVVIFLLVHVQDLQRERDAPKLEFLDAPSSGTGYRRYLVLFPDTARRTFDQWLSVVVGTGIVVTYVGLLCHRWLGWFG